MKQLILVAWIAAPLVAQWLKQPSPDIPRSPDGKPVLTAPAPKSPDGKPDLSGMWRLNPDDASIWILKPGEIQPWAADLHKQRLENRGHDSPQVTCLPLGPAYAYAEVNTLDPLKIVQTPNLIVILYSDLVYRQIFLDGRELPKDPNPSWMGYSIGHWEGDTLVVESSGFNDRTWLDGSGYPHSEDLRMMECFNRVDLSHMDLEVTFVDLKAYAKPITVPVKMTAVFDTEPLEYVCAENEKDRAHMAGKASIVDLPAALLAQYVGEYEAEPPPRRYSAPSDFDYCAQGRNARRDGRPLRPGCFSNAAVGDDFRGLGRHHRVRKERSGSGNASHFSRCRRRLSSEQEKVRS